MLNDRERNHAYNLAIRRAVTELLSEKESVSGGGDDGKKVTVLDVGAGTGILSLMAARAGAGRIWACEMNPLLCDVARETVAAEGKTCCFLLPAPTLTVTSRKIYDISIYAGLGPLAHCVTTFPVLQA